MEEEGQIPSLCLSQDVHLLLPLDISPHGSWAFRFGPGLTSLAPLVLRPLGLDWNHIAGFPGPLSYRQQTVGLLGLHNHVSQSFIINLFLSIYLSIYLSNLLVLFLWRTLTNTRAL